MCSIFIQNKVAPNVNRFHEKMRSRLAGNDSCGFSVAGILSEKSRGKWKALIISMFSLFLIAMVFPSVTFGFPQFQIFPKKKLEVDPRKYRLGRVQLHPGFAIESKYDDNILQQADKVFANGGSEGKEEDYIFTSKPSLGLDLERLRGEIFGFNLNYSGEDERFVNLGDSQNVFNHNVTGNLNFGGAGGKSDVTLGGSYDRSKNARAIDNQTTIGRRVNIETFTGLFDLVYLLSKTFRLEVGTGYEGKRFADPNQTFDSDLYNLTGSVFWQKTSLLAYGITYQRSQRDYLTNTNRFDDSSTDQVFIGARWNATPYIEGEFFFGVNSKKLDTFSQDDSINFVANFDVEYTPVERTRFTLSGSRQIRDSVFRESRFFIYHSIELSLVQDLADKFQAQISSRYENFDFRKQEFDITDGVVEVRIDHRVEVSVALIYKIQDWLQAKAEYSRTQKYSNFDAADFTNNVGLLEISVRY